jgi:diazepam-binding inhibitor (GABA receptor modulator, acyl-CoA-binding protein)
MSAAVSGMSFEESTKVVRTLTRKPDNAALLKLYGLYKQATIGDVNTGQPWSVQVEARAKWDAWNSNKGKPKPNAEKEYILTVQLLLKTHK